MTKQEEKTRELNWDGCHNARDLGGYRGADCLVTKWGAIARSDTLSRLSPQGIQALLACGIKTVVDLRKPEELASHPDPVGELEAGGVEYINISLVDPSGTPPDESISLAQDYIGMLEKYSGAVARVMRTIADAPPGGVLVHCMGGKDRTGIISALLLDLVGVARDTIAADYALTAVNLRSIDEEWLENGPRDREWRLREQIRTAAKPEVMLEVLGHLDTTYGGSEQYLQHAGVTSQVIALVRTRLTGEQE